MMGKRDFLAPFVDIFEVEGDASIRHKNTLDSNFRFGFGDVLLKLNSKPIRHERKKSMAFYVFMENRLKTLKCLALMAQSSGLEMAPDSNWNTLSYL